MSSFDSGSILPPDRCYTKHNMSSLRSHPANVLYRIHALHGRGAPIPRIGFVASAHDNNPDNAQDNTHYNGPPSQLKRDISSHITQWKDGTRDQPSQFISASFSLAYALFETRRWNAFHWCNTTQISVIDPSKIPADMFLGTEVVGAWWERDTFFARWAQEALVYGHIPQEAIIFTGDLEVFLGCLPRWCNEIVPQIRMRDVGSTEQMVAVLSAAARDPDNDTAEQQRVLLDHSVERSIKLLRRSLPFFMRQFNWLLHADAVDKISRFAIIWCWWPKWITSQNPAEYLPLFEAVRGRVIEQLVTMGAPTGVIRSRAAPRRTRTPYARPTKQE